MQNTRTIETPVSGPVLPRISPKFVLAALWLGALALRLIHVSLIERSPFASVLVVDARQYDAWAQHIAGGQWMGSGIFYQTPLYPYFLGVLYALIGHHVLAVRIVQCLLGATSCVLLVLAGRHFVGNRAALIAGVLLALYPEAIFWDAILQKSSLDLFLITLLLYALARMADRSSSARIVAAGLISGAFMLNRENARLLVPVIAIWLMAAPQTPGIIFSRLGSRKMIPGVFGRAALFVGCCFMVVLPVAWRNYAVGGEFVLSTAQLGPNFYIGNHTGASGTYDPLVPDHGSPLDEQSDATSLASAATGRALSASEVSNYWLARTLADIRRAPMAWLRLMGHKLLLTINAGEIVDTESIQEYARFSIVLRSLEWLSVGIIFPLAVAGLWMARRDGRSLTLVGSIWAVMTVAVALFYVVSRYRYPIVPVMLLFAGGTIASLSKPLAWRTSAAPFAMATIAAVLSYLPLTHATNVTFENTGAALTLEGHPLDAVPLLREAIAIDPADPRAHYDLGVALEHSGDADGAFSEYDAAVRIRPAFVEARDALGTSLRARGRAAEAAEHFAAAVQLSPGSSRAHLNYGVTLWELGRRDEALHEYEEAVRLQPEDSAAHNNLGVALVAIGRPSDAETQFRMAIDRNGGNFNAHANYGDLLSQIGRPDESVREYEQAARLAPDDLFTDLSLLRKLADAYASAGRITDARDTLKKAVLIAHTAHRDDLAEALANASRNWRN